MKTKAIGSGLITTLCCVSILMLLATCKKTEEENSPNNNPPESPSNPVPVNNATNIILSPHLSWICSDPENDPLSYDIFFGTSDNPPLFAADKTQSQYLISELSPDTKYYWRIVAKDNHGNSKTGPIWSFTTANSGNPTLPIVTTDSITNINQTTATGGGNVTSDGGATVTSRGVCWSTDTLPTISNDHSTDGDGTGNFTSNITGLTANTPYYVRAYATNIAGTAYGNQVSFTSAGGGTGGEPCPGIPTVTYAGKVYNTVQIGTQCWFKENLNIGNRINVNQNQTNNGVIEKHCYGDNEANCNTYGGLYQWDELMQYVTTQGAKGLCPDGWHIPTDAEWSTLTTYLGGESVAGGKLKEAGTVHWLSPNKGATNSSGFTALPGGCWYRMGNFFELTYYAFFWSSTEYALTHAWNRSLNCNSEDVGRHGYDKTTGFSVRCLKD